jgi:uncharacterized iron-regulated membrane protein
MKWSREVHKWVGLVLSVVFLLLSVTGVMLLFKKEWGFQPGTSKGEKAEVSQLMSIDQIISVGLSQGYEDLKTLKDIDRIDLRPGKNVAKLRSEEGREIQIEMTSGKVLHVAQRHDKLLENLHDGSFFGDWFKYIVVTSAGVSLILLTFSGFYIWGYSFVKRARAMRNEKKLKSKASVTV